MNFGIDFAGGTIIELRAKSGACRSRRRCANSARSSALGDIEVQAFGNASDATLRFGLQAGGDAAQQTAVEKHPQVAVGGEYELRRVEVVGPRVSGELVQSGTLGVVVSIIAVLGYLWFRFEWQFAVGAVIATMHDLLLTVGFFSLTQLEFNTTSIAAILTIVGYSLNETVVVLDRIREMMRKYKKMATAQIIDMSVNAVLPRTIMTATTVFLALLVAGRLRRPGHPLLLAGDDLGHFRRHLFVDLHLLADADLSRPAQERRPGHGGVGADGARAREDFHAGQDFRAGQNHRARQIGVRRQAGARQAENGLSGADGRARTWVCPGPT